jgi:heptosyltransferase-3
LTAAYLVSITFMMFVGSPDNNCKANLQPRHPPERNPYFAHMTFVQRIARSVDRGVRTAFYRHVLPALFPEQQRVPLARVRRLLLIRCDAVGDMILTTGLIHSLSRRNPAMEIWVAASDRNAPVVEADPAVARVVTIVRDGRVAHDAVRSLRVQGFDVVMNLVVNRATRYGWLARRVAPKALVVGLAHPDRPEYAGLFGFLVHVPCLYTQSFATTMVEFARQAFDLEIGDEEAFPSIVLDAADHAAAGNFFAAHGLPDMQPILVNVSAGQPRKRWPAKKYEQLTGELAAQGLACVLCGAPSDRDMGEGIARAVGAPLFIGRTVREVAAVALRCRLLVTPDTAIVHVASAMRRPMVGLYADEGTVLAQWAPIGIPNRLVRTPGASVEAIDVADVLAAIHDVLSNSPNA